MKNRLIFLFSLLILLTLTVALVYFHPERDSSCTMQDHQNKVVEKWLQQMHNYFDSGDNYAAERKARQILFSTPQNISALRMLGWQYCRRKEFSNALEVYLKILQDSPGDLTARNNCALILWQQKKFKEAQDEIQRALLIGGNHAAVLHNAAVIHNNGTHELPEMQDYMAMPETVAFPDMLVIAPDGIKLLEIPPEYAGESELI